GQTAGERRLADTGHVLEQQMAFGQQADQREVDDLALALDEPVDCAGDVLDRALELGCTELGQRLAGLDQQRLRCGCPGAASGPQPLGCHRATLPATCLPSVRSITGRNSAGNVTTSPVRPGPRTSRTASTFPLPNL